MLQLPAESFRCVFFSTAVFIVQENVLDSIHILMLAICRLETLWED